MGEALYRKYRPKSLDDVVGQPHITKTLSNALKSGRISHGYLFSGPRGVGKTSIARILAHQVNNFDYGDTTGALDIIEIDAASNRRIDEIRELRDKVHIAPTHGKYKVYIIDEVHMLTREAFNALLKTLEEPPAHVIFILATTEAHKLPETIISRTQHFTFKPVSQADALSHIKYLADKEGIKISNASVALIAKHGGGSFRDSIGLLDQLSLNKQIEEDDVRQLLGIPPEEQVDTLLSDIHSGDLISLTNNLEETENRGFNAIQISSQIAELVRDQLIAGKTNHSAVEFLDKLIKVPASVNPAQYLELILIDEALKYAKPELQTKHNEPPKPNDTLKESKPSKHLEKPAPKPAAETKGTKPIKRATNINTEIWDKVLAIIRQKYNTLYGVARMATPVIEDDVLVLKVPFAFHQKRLSAEKNSAVINATLTEVTGGSVQFRTEVDKSTSVSNPDKKPTPHATSSDTLQAVTQIFGGGEVLET